MIKHCFDGLPKTKTKNKQRQILEVTNNNSYMFFLLFFIHFLLFYGASKGNPCICAVGGYLYLYNTHWICFVMVLAIYTNKLSVTQTFLHLIGHNKGEEGERDLDSRRF
jgi:hypothetical protein